ncbi:MAG TPA: STAS domain-containing protein [Hanamia sp.]
MKVKIDTKEKMNVISVEDEKLAANMTEDLKKTFLKFLNEPIKNVVVNFEKVHEIDDKVADILIFIQQSFYVAAHSMVFCNFHPAVAKFLDERRSLEIMNVTPSESEAWDIVQMEEVERELLF